MAVPSRFTKIVGGASAAAGAVGVPGAFSFGSDVIVLKGIWVTGILLICSEAKVKLTKKEALQLATAGLVGAATFVAGSKIAAKLFHLIPGPGTLAAIGINSFLDAFFTYSFLRSVAKIMEKYDEEHLALEAVKSGLSLFSIMTFFDDVKDMNDCIAQGMHLKDLFGGDNITSDSDRYFK
jgi:hypothetical protein